MVIGYKNNRLEENENLTNEQNETAVSEGFIQPIDISGLTSKQTINNTVNAVKSMQSMGHTSLIDGKT